MSGRLTTHVLDICRGRPAAGLRVQLFARDEEGRGMLLRDERTNPDGRLDKPLLQGSELLAGNYELLFWAGEYFGSGESGEAFFESIAVRFRVTDPDSHYHVPLLAAPGGYSAYRGS